MRRVDPDTVDVGRRVERVVDLLAVVLVHQHGDVLLNKKGVSPLRVAMMNPHQKRHFVELKLMHEGQITYPIEEMVIK